ncbi:uncharacterized protein LOC114346223 isoform X2 [Diabrotica virgifera virgifera]|uniref:Uncharacterized protein LOC114346223 isoform X2 n=1 Tax=Diabrotica virgifera virgifera TaxID=50390 RepID=A0A6P7H545_DIAVI|nr:uncharacterized protein LOC114346223 isoform X2 [Diabrotica virgifera virgifera]
MILNFTKKNLPMMLPMQSKISTINRMQTIFDQPPVSNQNITDSDNYSSFQIDSNNYCYHQNSTEELKQLPRSINDEQMKSTTKEIKFSDEITIASNNNNEYTAVNSTLYTGTLTEVQIDSNNSSRHQNSTGGLKELPSIANVEQLKSNVTEIKFSDEITIVGKDNNEDFVVESTPLTETLTEVQMVSNSSSFHQNSTGELKELLSIVNAEKLKSNIKEIKFIDEITIAGNINKEDSLAESTLLTETLTEVQIDSNSSSCHQNSTGGLKEPPSIANVEQLKSNIKGIKFSDKITIVGKDNNEDFAVESTLPTETLTEVQMVSNSSSFHQNSTGELKELHSIKNVVHLKSHIKEIKFSDEITIAGNINNEDSVAESTLRTETLTEVQIGSNSSSCHQNSTGELKELLSIVNVEQLKSNIKEIKFIDEITIAGNINNEDSVAESTLLTETLTEVQIGSNSSSCHQNSTEGLKELPSIANVEQRASNKITIKHNINNANSAVNVPETETVIEVPMDLKGSICHQNNTEGLKEISPSTNVIQVKPNIKVILGDEITIADNVNNEGSTMKSSLPTEILIEELHNRSDGLISALGLELDKEQPQEIVANIERDRSSYFLVNILAGTQFKGFDRSVATSDDNNSKIQYKRKQTKSILKRKNSVEENKEPQAKKRKKGITFDSVTIFQFPRAQGFTCIPTQGGCTLGMEAHHSDKKTFSVAEHALEKRNRREVVQKHRSHKRNGTRGKKICNEKTNVKDAPYEGSDKDNSDVLQRLHLSQRRALLRAAGVTRIDMTESDECRNIRTSRMLCGCGCKENCDPDTCSCSQSGIECQVDADHFPCKCSRENCRNLKGRIEFSKDRVRIHYTRTLMRTNLNKQEDWMARLDGQDLTPVLQQNQSFAGCVIDNYFNP